MDRQEVADWIAANLLDTDAWDRASEQKQAVAVVQAERNLARWYPDKSPFPVEVVALQAVWELQGVDPALKYQKHNVKTISDNGESVTYKDGERPAVAPDVREMLGPTADELAEQEAEEAAQRQYGGVLI
ncbi:MAG: hypothetical protein C6P35_03245 [Cohnella sp.]|uniref:hypothetical protein n=1 Tax=Cohnella sp. TaxID=1883426 RepID=UPI000E3A4C1A|nr:hypothetical protein [Cohnella sp.]REK67999.1 MAG: hypothetical protein C6P35_03245 [Cohnella sp.]